VQYSELHEAFQLIGWARAVPGLLKHALKDFRRLLKPPQASHLQSLLNVILQKGTSLLTLHRAGTNHQ
ncbi:MAG: hypothetical protein KKD59_07825, partial [Acidobacteria bacterium]|nr:hypothetical protein [Acidobacteriota bacterium]